MTTTDLAPTDAAALLDQAIAALKVRPLRNALGMAVEAVVGPDGALRAAGPSGRLVVAPGQTVSSAWGNTVFDNSVICFASAADRDTQWPAPHAGAVCYTLDTRSMWNHDGTAWVLRGVNYATERATNSGARVDIASRAWGAIVHPTSTKGNWTVGGGVMTMARPGTLFVAMSSSFNNTTGSLAGNRIMHNGLIATYNSSVNLGGGNLFGGVTYSAPVNAGDTVQVAIMNMADVSSAYLTTTEVTYQG